MADYLADCEDNDPGVIAHALGAVARARDMSQFARQTGMTRAGLARAGLQRQPQLRHERLDGQTDPEWTPGRKISAATRSWCPQE